MWNSNFSLKPENPTVPKETLKSTLQRNNTYEEKKKNNCCVFSTSFSRLTNSGKSKHNNPRIIYSWPSVNPLMTFLMKVTSLQNGDCSFSFSFFFAAVLHRAWGDKLNTFLNSSQHQLASWLGGDTRQDWCVLLTNSRDGHLYGRDAAWQCEGKSHLAEQFPHTACSFRFVLPEEIISREIALASTDSVSALIRSHGSTTTSEAWREAPPPWVNIR